MSTGTYGLWTANLPFVGALTAGDVVHVRSNNATISMANVGYTWNTASQGTLAAPITYLIDNNNKWADGAANNGLSFIVNNPNGITIDFNNGGTAYVIIKAARKSDGTPALKFGTSGTTGGGGLIVYPRYGMPMTFENVDLWVDSPTLATLSFRDNGSNELTRYVNCRIRTGQSAQIVLSSFGSGKCIFEGGEISNLGSTGLQVGSPLAYVINMSAGCDFMQFVGTRFTNFVTGSRLMAEGPSGRYVFTDCDFGGITVRSPNCYNTTYATSWVTRTVAITAQQGTRDWSIDSTLGIAEWNGARSFPVRAGTLFDGVTKWSMRFCASTQSGLGPTRCFALPRIAKYNTLSNGTRTVTTHFVLEKGMAWTAADIWVRVQYIDTSGVLQTVSSQDPLGGALADDSAGALWSQYGSGADANNVVWNNAGNLYHKQYKIAVSCPNMAINTEVAVYLVLGKSAATVSQGGFLDPDFDIV